MANDFSDEHVVDLALAATTEPGGGTPCPTAEELAALGEGGLTPDRRAEIFAHLDTCPECMNAWLAVSSTDERAIPAPTPARVCEARRISPLFVKAAAGLAAMAACLLLVVYLVPREQSGPGYAVAVNDGYRMVLDQPRMYAELIGRAGDMAATETRSETSPAARTFADGWRSGLEALLHGQASSEPPSGNGLKSYVFSAGRWSALVHAALGSDTLPDGFWTQQLQTAQRFEDRTSTLPPGDQPRHNQLWTGMIETLERLHGGTPAAVDRDRLRRQLNGLGRVMADLDLGRE